MLSPVYFPFTYLGERAAAALQVHFGCISLLRPFAEGLPPRMRELQQRGFLEILAPVPGDEIEGAAAVGQLLEWARRHVGGAGVTGAFWQAHLAGDPLGGERSVYRLASQIKCRPLPVQGPAKADPLLAARVFLRLAQELDQQADELFRDLARHQRRSVELMEALVGRLSPPPSGRTPAATPPPSGREEHRLPERLIAWARLFQVRACPSPVLATTSTATVKLLMERSVAARRLPLMPRQQRGRAALESPKTSATPLMDEIAGWVAAPKARIEALPFAGPVEDGVPGGGGLLVTLFPDETPHRLLSRFAAAYSEMETATPNAHPWDHTIVVLVPPVGLRQPCVA